MRKTVLIDWCKFNKHVLLRNGCKFTFETTDRDDDNIKVMMVAVVIGS